MNAWDVVDHLIDKNIIDLTGAFMLKHFHDDMIKKFKARFCACGYLQLEGVDFFETYAPVLQVDLEEEDDAAGFLGVCMEHDPQTGLLELKQTGLIDQVIEALGLDVGTAKCKYTPTASKPLVKSEKGMAISGEFSYSSVIGMLLYLLGHTCPDIAYAVNYSHELALKQKGQDLKVTQTRGLVLNPLGALKIDAYSDADFAGTYGHEKPTNPFCVKSQMGMTSW
ncbi:hypothetical protein ACHAXS_003993 [Conticribra weissflogii]